MAYAKKTYDIKKDAQDAQFYDNKNTYAHYVERAKAKGNFVECEAIDMDDIAKINKNTNFDATRWK